jgi:tetratricopeptide (TPR) repeat protein
MPPNRSHPVHGRRIIVSCGCLCLFKVAALAAEPPAAIQASDPTPVRARSVELHYRLAGAEPGARVELWYTRDRAATWQHAGVDDDGVSPLIFTAPAEGLYGFTLDLRNGTDTPTPPAAHQAPQRWVFIDYNPPLAQWDAVEADDEFATRRIVHLRWTAYDDHFTARPVALAYQSSVDGNWQVIDGSLPNTGRYDWTVPAAVTTQVSLKLTAIDLGGHSVERIYGPTPVERWLKTPAPTTQPAAVATRPASEPNETALAGVPASAELEKRLEAQDLHRQGAWHLQNGRYAVAAERFREALEADPDLSVARCDLAGIYYLQQDYGKALEHYNAILARDAKYLPALRGAALAHGALRQYPQTRDTLKKLLAIKDNDAQAWFDLGDAMFMMGDTLAARNDWTKASTVDAAAEPLIRKAKRRLELYGVGSSETAAGANR